MHLNEYQQRASKTSIYPDEIKRMLEPIEHHGDIYGMLMGLFRLNYVAGGLAGEAGEFANKVKKLIRDNAGFVYDHETRELAKELGGTLWYISQAAKEIGWNLEDIAALNLMQLADRAERGKIKGSGDDR